MQWNITNIGSNNTDLIGIHQNVKFYQVFDRHLGVSAAEEKNKYGASVVTDLYLIILEIFPIDGWEVVLPRKIIGLGKKNEQIKQRKHRICE